MSHEYQGDEKPQFPVITGRDAVYRDRSVRSRSRRTTVPSGATTGLATTCPVASPAPASPRRRPCLTPVENDPSSTSRAAVIRLTVVHPANGLAMSRADGRRQTKGARRRLHRLLAGRVRSHSVSPGMCSHSCRSFERNARKRGVASGNPDAHPSQRRRNWGVRRWPHSRSTLGLCRTPRAWCRWRRSYMP